jgi:hypothetical protein
MISSSEDGSRGRTESTCLKDHWLSGCRSQDILQRAVAARDSVLAEMAAFSNHLMDPMIYVC